MQLNPTQCLIFCVSVAIPFTAVAAGELQGTPSPITSPPPSISSTTTPEPKTPVELPGRGLLEHDFFYTGQNGNVQDMYIVRKGQVVWASHNDIASKGEISDATLLSNGNILFARQFGITLITPEKKVLWNYDAPPHCEIHTGQPIGTERVLFIQNGPKPKVMIVNVTSGKTEKEFPLTVKNPSSTHLQFRHARLTDAGTLLVAHADLGKACEYDETGAVIWSFEVPRSWFNSPGCWSAIRLKNGNTLIVAFDLDRKSPLNKTGADNHWGRQVFEVNAKGALVWEYREADVADYKDLWFQTATRLPNGNTLISSWANSPNSSKVDPARTSAQALEVTPDKKIVWALRSWKTPNLGPCTIIQLLDTPSKPEDVHFGSIH